MFRRTSSAGGKRATPLSPARRPPVEGGTQPVLENDDRAVERAGGPAASTKQLSWAEAPFHDTAGEDLADERDRRERNRDGRWNRGERGGLWRISHYSSAPHSSRTAQNDNGLAVVLVNWSEESQKISSLSASPKVLLSHSNLANHNEVNGIVYQV